MLHRAAFHQWECVDLLVRALDIISILLYEMRSVIADAASDTYREDLSSTVGPCHKNKDLEGNHLRFI